MFKYLSAGRKLSSVKIHFLYFGEQYTFYVIKNFKVLVNLQFLKFYKTIPA